MISLEKYKVVRENLLKALEADEVQVEFDKIMLNHVEHKIEQLEVKKK